MKTRRWILILLVLACSLSLLTGCKFDGKPLLIHEVKGNFYVEFAKTYEFEPDTSHTEPKVWFTCLAALQKEFLEYTMTDAKIRTFQRRMKEEEYGYLICDLKNMYEPVVPSDVSLYTEVVLYKGENYEFHCEWRDLTGTITFWTGDELGLRLSETAIYATADELETLTHRGQKARCYRYFGDGEGYSKIYRYEAKDGEDGLYIREGYTVEETEEYLYSVHFIRIKPNGKSFEVFLSRGNGETSYSDLSLEWITEFNSQEYPYVPGREIDLDECVLSKTHPYYIDEKTGEKTYE